MDDLVTRYNHIEALNNNLKQETEKLAAERASYKDMLDREQEAAQNEMNAQIAKNDADLARIRAVRDEAVQDGTMRKIAADKHLSTLDEINELAAARKSRIDALETEVSRLRHQLSEEKAVPDAEVSALNHDELLEKYSGLQRAYKILEEELPNLESAWKKTHELASNKVINLQESSAKMEKLVQEVC